MSSDSFTLTTRFSATSEEIWDAWLDGERHGEMTGAQAGCDARPGGTFTAWGGYIRGTNLELERPRRILQRWRTSEFADADDDSILEILLAPLDGGTELTLSHSAIPSGQGASYEQGWEDHYFAPMRDWLATRPGAPAGD